LLFLQQKPFGKMTTITLKYDENNQLVLDALGNLISSGLASVDETIPEGSMTVSQFSALLKNGIRKHYEDQRSNHSAASQG